MSVLVTMEAEGQSERQVSLNSNTRRETRRSGTLEERYNDRGSLELRLLTDRWENEGKRTAPVHFVECEHVLSEYYEVDM